MDVRDLRGKTCLVTGAGSGIGRETALAFGSKGANLVMCDLNEDGLSQTGARLRDSGCNVLARRVDVADREQMRGFAAEVHQQVEAVDILMNNAGVGLGARFADTSLEDWDWIIGINLYGVIHGCHFFVPPMVSRGRGGHVINISSGAGYVASEPLSAYSTTKFAVFGLSEALRQEVGPAGIGVTTVCPGIINTPITQTSPLRGAIATEAARRSMVELYRRRNYGPERVARGILDAVQKNRAVAPISPEAWAMYYLKRLSPAAVAWLNRKLNARRQREIERAEAGLGPR